MIYTTEWQSPLGSILLTSNGEALTGLFLNRPQDDVTLLAAVFGKHAPEQAVRNDDTSPFPEVKRQLAAYFEGKRTHFDIPLAPQGTRFQQRVWAELQRIPYGETISYGELARRIDQPNSSRAVGLANGRNPISILLPCHRVIGANGKLTGYSGGLSRKEALLSFEAAVHAQGPHPFPSVAK